MNNDHPNRLKRAALLFADLTIYLALLIFALIRRPDRLSFLGAAITLPCFALALLARFQLGASFTPKAEARSLVRHGLYSRLRHPVYFFGMLGLLGIALALRSIYFNAYLVITIIGLMWRIRREDRVLRAKFGDDYLAYRKQIWL
jgi:protein-S-isoprenylcysteine O-methyltransferase Ste14